MKRNGLIGLLLAMVVLVTGCASVPMASLEEDAKAKLFSARPDKSTHSGRRGLEGPTARAGRQVYGHHHLLGGPPPLGASGVLLYRYKGGVGTQQAVGQGQILRLSLAGRSAAPVEARDVL